MSKRMLYFVGVLLVGLLSLTGCTLTSFYDHVERFEMEVLPAPELRGFGSYQKPNTSSVRLSAQVNLGQSGSETFSTLENSLSGCGRIEDCDGFNKSDFKERVTAIYQFVSPIAMASFDYVTKWDMFLIGLSLGADYGGYADFLVGINTKYFELGAAVGLWMMAREFKYMGTEFECTKGIWGAEDDFRYREFGNSNTGAMVGFYGGYITAYYGPFSLNYSFDIYRPNPSYTEVDIVADFDLPLVMTEYIMAGYRFNKNWEFRLGATNVFGEFPGWHWSFNGGVSYYL